MELTVAIRRPKRIKLKLRVPKRLKIHKPKRLNIPMVLTWTRIAFIPLLVAVFYLPQAWIEPHLRNVIATVVFAIAGVTDALDGYIARRLNMMTMKGAFLDAVADKLFVCTAIVMLMSLGRIEAMVALIVICREIAVTALREWMAKIKMDRFVKVNSWGKVKTIVQMVAIGFLTYHDPCMGLPVHLIGTVLIYIACALTLYSMIVYLTAAWPIIEAKDEEN